MFQRGIGGVVNPIVKSVDVDDILARIDMDALLARVDMDAVLSRIDFNAVVDRIEIDAVVERIDVNRLIQRSNLEKIIARSTSGLFTHLLDSIRAQVIRLDQILQNLARCACCCRNRYGVRGERVALPPRPQDLFKNGKDFPRQQEQVRIVAGNNRKDGKERLPVKAGDLALAVQGRAAGLASRTIAWLIDELIVSVSFTLALALVRVAMNMLNEDDRISEVQQKARILLIPLLLISWGTVYDAASWSMVGRTLGMAIMGLLVVSHSGQPVRAPQAFLRACLMSIWVFVVFLSPLGLLRKDRRQWHDLLVCTTVIYSWDARNYKMHESEASDAEKLGPEFSTYNLNDSESDDDDDDEESNRNGNDDAASRYSSAHSSV